MLEEGRLAPNCQPLAAAKILYFFYYLIASLRVLRAPFIPSSPQLCTHGEQLEFGVVFQIIMIIFKALKRNPTSGQSYGPAPCSLQELQTLVAAGEGIVQTWLQRAKCF